MTVDQYLEAVEEIKFGKRLPEYLYIYRYSGARLNKELKKLLESFAFFNDISRRYNVLKFHLGQFRVSFLSYPDFFTVAHPSLKAAASCNLLKGEQSVEKVNYSKCENPPILHRKELMLPETHKARRTMELMTQAEEREGLYDNPSIIGNLKAWEKLLQSKGLSHLGHRLVYV